MKTKQKESITQITYMLPEDKVAITHDNKIYIIPKDTFEMFTRKGYSLVKSLVEEYVNLMKIKPISLPYEKPSAQIEPS